MNEQYNQADNIKKEREYWTKIKKLANEDNVVEFSGLFFGGNKKESENEINKKLGNMLFLNKGGCAVYDIKNDKETSCVGCVTKKVIIK